MGGRGAKIGAKNGLKTVNQWLNEMQSGKFEFVKTKKWLKKELENTTGKKQRDAKKNLLNYTKAREERARLNREYADASREKWKKQQAEVRNAWFQTTTTTYQRWKKRHEAKIDEYIRQGK